MTPEHQHDHFAAIIAQFQLTVIQVFALDFRRGLADGESAQFVKLRLRQVRQPSSIPLHLTKIGNDPSEHHFRFLGGWLVLAIFRGVLAQSREREAGIAANGVVRIPFD